MRLTDISCRTSKPTEKNYKLRDGQGLYLLVMQAGGKSWRYDYKLKRNDDSYKNGTFVIGTYPSTTLAQAREMHQQARSLVSNGTDPHEFKKEQERIKRQERALTFSLIAEEWLEKRKQEVKEKTIKDIEKRLERDVLPQIGDIPIKDISTIDIIDMLKKIEERGAYEMRNRARQYCSQIFRYAMAIGSADRDYTADVSDALAVRRVKHQPALQPHEIPELLSALQQNDARLFLQTRLALQMLMLTFVRPIELAAAEWSEFDFKTKLWTIPASKMKMRQDHVVPIANQSLQILHEMQKLNGNRQYVFTKQTNPKQHIHRDTLSKAVRSLGFKGKHTAHGFRAMARTTIREKLNYDSEIIERQLAHAPNTSLGRAYDRTQFLEQRITMMQEWADYIDDLQTSKVIKWQKQLQTA